MIGPGRSLAGSRMEPKSRATMINWFVGKVIPPLLVVYGVSSYSLFWISYINIWLYLTASNYLRVYIATDQAAGAPLLKPERDCDPHSGLPESPWAWVRWARRTFAPLRLRDQYVLPPDERAFQAVRRGMIHQCTQDGSLIRCYKGTCQGRWKPARTRHCSVCQTCRFALDHHCPLFDHDIVAKQTFGSFIAFLVSAPMLLLPLLPLMWAHTLRHARAIARFAWTSPQMHEAWWSKRWTWLGGPSLRYFGALVQAQRMLNRTRPEGAEKLSIWPVAMLFLALMLSVIALALLGTTVRESLKGGLAIDRERHKFFERKARQAAKKAAAEARRSSTDHGHAHDLPGTSVASESHDRLRSRARPSERPDEPEGADGGADSKTPSPWLYFWVPMAAFEVYLSKGSMGQLGLTSGQEDARQKGGVVVKMHELDRPYIWPVRSWYTLFEHIEPLYSTTAQAQWPLPLSVREALARRAAAQFAQLP